MRTTAARRRAFTLVELLVVIAIIGVLIALLLPAVQRVREAVNQASCASQMKQLAIACHSYENDYGHFPPGGRYGKQPGWDIICHYPQGNWLVFTLPYMDQQNL